MEKPESQYNMIDWWKKVLFKNYANFNGRAARPEYWWFVLFNIILIVPFYILGIVGAAQQNLLLASIGVLTYALIALVTLIPSIAVAVRRLHDVNKSGWYYLLVFIPFIGSIILLVWFCTAGDWSANQYGEDPRDQEGLHFDFDHPQSPL